MYTCCRYYGLEGVAGHEGDSAFTVEVNHFTFGPGCLREAGSHARALGMKIMIGCMIESSVLISAAAHLAALADHLDGRKQAGVKRRLEHLKPFDLEAAIGEFGAFRHARRLASAEGFFRALADTLRA